MEEEVAAIALKQIKGLGPRLIREISRKAGSLRAVFDYDWQGEEAVGSHLKKLLSPGQLDCVWENGLSINKRHKDLGIELVPFTSEAYPKRLLHCSDAPVLLYKKGKADLNQRKVLSIVGTRKATSYGRIFIDKLGEGLKDKEVMIISGLAYGIDTLAHKMSLKNALPTVGVMGTGFHIMYPASNKKLAEDICVQGALLTEYPIGEEAVPGNFAMRNRIIAGMSDAVLVVETGPKGGAMITARLANSYNRDVLAVPGRVGDLYSAGCNNLIRNQQAHLVASASDLLYILGWDDPPKPKVNQGVLALEMTDMERSIAEFLRERGERGIDELALDLRLPVSELAVLLLQMELQGFIRELPGKRYTLNM